VIFTALPPVNLATCANPGSDPGPALLASWEDQCTKDFPTYGGGCGNPSLTTITDYKGANAQVILGPMPGALYRITAKVGDLATSFVRYSWPTVYCDFTDPPMFFLRIGLQYQADQFGNRIEAGPVGGKIPVKASCTLLREDETIREDGSSVGNGTYYLDPGQPMAVSLGAERMPGNGRGMYKGDYTLAAEPEMNTINVSCSSVIEGETYAVYDTMQAAGVEVRFPYQADGSALPPALVVPVTGEGYLTRDQVLSYQILPGEYKAGSAYLFVYHDGGLIMIIPTEKTGIGFATLARGLWLEPGGNYEAEVVLNPGSGVEIKSTKVPLRVVSLELGADLNGDGIFAEDDPQEYTSPGLIVPLNRSDDNGNRQVDLEDLTNDSVDAHGNRVPDPDLIKVELKGLPDDLETGSMFLELVAGQEQLRIWDSPDKLHLLLEPWAATADPPDSNPMALWPLGGGYNVGKLPKEIYLEGVKESKLSGEIQLRAGYLPPDGGEAVETDRLAITVVNVEMHVDEDRNGTISFYQPGDVDLVGDAKYTFWLNNDYDNMHYEESEWHEDDMDNVGSGKKNSDDIYIGYRHESDPDNAYNSYSGCKRDLEDFAMLQLRVPVWLKDMDGVKYSLKFKDEVTGNPAINLFEAVNDRQKYIEKDSTANDQILKTKLNNKPISNGDGFEIPRELVDKDGLVAPFIFEGVTEGSGELELTVKIDDVVLAQSSVTLNLHDIKWFYDRFALQGVSGTSWRAQVGNAATPLSLAAYTSISPSSDYLLFVHGWNMLPHEKYRWAETIFKRLWWQGYTGKVGAFEWPCLEFSPMPDVITDPTNFSDSEFVAWQSAEALKKLLTELGGTYQLSVLAHSQGNVVMGEALKKYPGPQLKAYIASQAAISANVYDNGNNLAEPSWFLIFENHFPNVYSHFSSGLNPDVPYFTGNSAKVGKSLNYFNVKDYALTGMRWELNNAIKPFHDFDYADKDGNPYQFNQAGGDKFFRTDMITDSNGDASFEDVDLDIGNDRDKYSIFSYIAESKVMALGTQAVSSGLALNRDLTDWNFGDGHYSHSRQFRSNIVSEKAYWEQVIKDCKLVTIKQENSR